MKDKEIVKKLQLLQSVQPEQSILREVRKTILSYSNEELFIHRKWYQKQTFVPLIIAACVIILLTISFTSGETFFFIKLALSSNQYEKAKIAFAYTSSHYPSTAIKLATVREEEQSLKLTNTEMSELKLMGEKGKYSAQQCHELYTAYHSYLEKLEKVQVRLPQAKVLATDIKQYDEQAEEKLHKYHK